MVARFDSEWPHHLRNIQRIAANGSDGVIMIDVHQTVRWANAAALAMHAVSSPAELGRTIDEYHANFKVRFRGSRAVVSDEAIGSVTSGETFRDVIIEVTPLYGTTPQWVYSVRNLVLVDENGIPTCIVLVLRPAGETACTKGQFRDSLDAIQNAAAIMRQGDRQFIEANAAFLRLLAIDRAALSDGTLSLADLLVHCQEPDAVRASMDDGKPLAFLQLRRPDAADGGVSSGPLLLSARPIDYLDQSCMLFNIIETVPAGASMHQPGHEADAIGRKAGELCALSPVPMHALDATMRILAVSDSWLDLFGYERDATIGRSILDFLTPSSASHFSSHTWPALWSAGAARDLTADFVTGFGGTIEATVSARMALDEAGAPQFVVAAPVDVSERQQWRNSFDKLFALSPVPMLIRKLDDPRILDINDAFVAATGYTQQTMAGHMLDEMGIFESRAQRQQFETALRNSDQVLNMDARVKTAHGDTIDCLLSAQKVTAFGQVCALLILRDVSDRRRDEQGLFEAIETVMRDTSWFSRSVIEKLAAVRSPPRSGARPTEIGELTPREREVLGMISHGLGDVDIATKLGLTRSTVRNHVATLYSKIGVHSRSSAIIWARERGINFAWPSPSGGNFIPVPLDRDKTRVPSLASKNRRA